MQFDGQDIEKHPYSNLPVAPVVRGVGGMGSFWSCATPEMHPELERPDLFTDEEWALLYARAKSLFHTSQTEFDLSVRHRYVKDALIRAHPDREFINLPLACERSKKNPKYVQWSSPARILGDLADPKYKGRNFELKAHHRCNRLLLDGASREVLGAEITDLSTNEVLIVKAKKYVVCAGATLTAGVLWQSGIRPDTGYPALVNKYLSLQVSTSQFSLTGRITGPLLDRTNHDSLPGCPQGPDNSGHVGSPS